MFFLDLLFQHKRQKITFLLYVGVLIVTFLFHRKLTYQNKANQPYKSHLQTTSNEIKTQEIGLIEDENLVTNRSTTVFCFIKSYLSNYKINKTATVFKVWGRKCDDYRFIMLVPEELRPPNWKLGKETEIDTPFKIIQPESLESETHEKVTRKIYHAFVSIFNRYPNFDWYYLVDDDSYVNVKNLRLFLKTKNSSEKVTFGYNLKASFFQIFILNEYLRNE